eukprot:TRINITY_DN15980_c0_g1_i1.p1 TRINITY_DN15980_c0_g1~~TRINITY_DN15980_c0_g1_i1.p1  ORF type:complete len:610 (+),score=142.10 TRINITY_DN15980_c0_g1_i1:86-1915(+)
MNEDEFQTKMDEIMELACEEAPNSNIFLKKHEARSEMTSLRTKLVDQAKGAPEEMNNLHMLARLNMAIAQNLFEVESDQEGYEYLERAEQLWDTLHNKVAYDWDTGFQKDTMIKCKTKLNNDTDMTYVPFLLDAFNLAGYHWCGRGMVEKALTCLNHSVKIYEHFDKRSRTEGDAGYQALNISDDGQTTTTRGKVEGSYTSTLFYLAQVYGNDSKSEEASKYCHLTLQRQLASKKEFDRIEWSINALGLCSFYLNLNDFGASKHCILAAEKVMEKYAEAGDDMSNEKAQQTIANIHQAKAKWNYYYVKHYRDNAMGYAEDDEPEPPATLPIEWWVNFTCDIPDPEQPKPIPFNKKGWTMILPLFKEARTQWNKALEWYIFDGFVTDYIQIMQDLSAFYKLLSTWDRDDTDPIGALIDRHCSIHKERAKLLEGIPDQLNDKHYLNYQRQIWFEVGEIYNEICELRITQRNKKSEIKSTQKEPLSKVAINKIMTLAEKSFVKFSDSFLLEDGKPPSDMDPDVCHAFISSRMHAIRLASKKYAKSAEKEYKQLELAVAEYNELISWAEAHPRYKDKLCAEETTKLQIELAKEVSRMLPSKMRDIRRAYNIQA